MGKFGINFKDTNEKLDSFITKLEILQDALKVLAHNNENGYLQKNFISDLTTVNEAIFSLVSYSSSKYQNMLNTLEEDARGKQLEEDKSELESIWFALDPLSKSKKTMSELIGKNRRDFRPRDMSKASFINQKFSNGELGSYIAFISTKVDLSDIMNKQNTTLKISSDLYNIFAKYQNKPEELSELANQYNVSLEDSEKNITGKKKLYYEDNNGHNLSEETIKQNGLLAEAELGKKENQFDDLIFNQENEINDNELKELDLSKDLVIEELDNNIIISDEGEEIEIFERKTEKLEEIIENKEPVEIVEENKVEKLNEEIKQEDEIDLLLQSIEDKQKDIEESKEIEIENVEVIKENIQPEEIVNEVKEEKEPIEIKEIVPEKEDRIAVYGAADLQTFSRYFSACKNQKETEKQMTKFLDDCVSGKTKLAGFKDGITRSLDGLGELGRYAYNMLDKVNEDINKNKYITTKFLKGKLDRRADGATVASDMLNKFYIDLGIKDKQILNDDQKDTYRRRNYFKDGVSTLLRMKEIQKERPWHYWLTSWKKDTIEKNAIKEMENYLVNNFGCSKDQLSLEYTKTLRNGNKAKITNSTAECLDKVNSICNDIDGINNLNIEKDYESRSKSRKEIINPEIDSRIDNTNKMDKDFYNKLKESTTEKIFTVNNNIIGKNEKKLEQNKNINTSKK